MLYFLKKKCIKASFENKKYQMHSQIKIFFFIPADAYSSSILKELEMLNFLDSDKHIICLGTSTITSKMEALYRLKHPMY